VGESGVPSEEKAAASRRTPKDYEVVTMSPDLHWPERLGALYSAVVADVLDRLGRRHQVMASGIRPLAQGMRVAGRALTALAVPEREGAPERPYAGEIQAVDALGPGDVLVASSCEFSLWGELLSTAARARGAHGVVLDGPTRDTSSIRAMGFPVFCRGTHPADSLGRVRVEAHNVPIVCGSTLVRPGDLVLADDDGVVVVPAEMAEEVLSLAEEKVRGENKVREALAAGMTVAEAFHKFGIL
jgi:regulator of RNase E activity RraA